MPSTLDSRKLPWYCTGAGGRLLKFGGDAVVALVRGRGNHAVRRLHAEEACGARASRVVDDFPHQPGRSCFFPGEV